ncbi:MAG: PDGLE domain-containing protein [Chloroflexota bacterium]|nr:PDGLE domain-containing protein [Chloroflexota bacterium]
MGKRWWIVGLLIALAITLLSPFASSSPDGLERVAEDKGYLGKAKDAPYHLIADYVFPWVPNEAAATILAGLVGTVIVFAVVTGMAYWLQRTARGQARS